MKSGVRDRLILMLFPALIVALVWWGWMRPWARTTRLVQALQDARATAPDPSTVAKYHERLGVLQNESTRLEQEQRKQFVRWHQLQSSFTAGSRHSAMLQRVSDLFRQHQLVILHETVASSVSHSADIQWLEDWRKTFGQPLETVVPELKTHPELDAIVASAVGGATESASRGRGPPVMWQIEFAGTYANARAALNSVVGELEVMPVQLTMAPVDPALRLRRWTIIVAL